MPRRIEDSVVVITGASSGIGRAAAVSFARRGARVVLSARAAEDLAAVATECQRSGAQALAVAADVRSPEQIETLGRRAVERFGRIDVWVNGAGVISYGRFDDTPADVFRNVLETNLMGQVHGARVALPRFRRQGTGVLINMSSVWGRVTSPHVSAYVTSKHAVRAFSECLRHELVPGEDVHVATMLPQAVDTPIFDNAANYGRRRVRPIPPISDPQKVAEGILQCAESPKREVTFGRAGRALELLYAFLPRLYCRVAPGMFMRGSFTREPAPPAPGNVLEPLPDGHRVSGRWRSDRRRELVGALLAAARGGLAGLAGRR